jgi:hypothetical protein
MLFMASFHMEGRAITWFQEMEETRALTSYELFVKAIQIQLEISSHAMVGGLNPKTMRVKARINSHFLVFVIDTRSTHDFLYPSITKKARLEILSQSSVGVKIME